MAELKNCPVCGKKPKIRIEGSYPYIYMGGGWVDIYCRKWNQIKPHCRVSASGDTIKEAVAKATKMWNDIADKEKLKEND